MGFFFGKKVQDFADSTERVSQLVVRAGRVDFVVVVLSNVYGGEDFDVVLVPIQCKLRAGSE